MTSASLSHEDPDWMFKPLGISQYYSTQPNKNCGDGGDE
jgi:hypothetical protein